MASRYRGSRLNSLRAAEGEDPSPPEEAGLNLNRPDRGEWTGGAWGGGSLIDARLLSELLNEMGVEGSRFQGAEGALEALTPREQEVLQFLVRGLTNRETASEMDYSVGRVKNVVQRVIEKLGVSDRTQAAVYTVRAGLNPPPGP